MNKLQIIIPVFNEGENIVNTLNEINNKIAVPYEIMVVYDFDEDNTLPVVNLYKEQYKSLNICLMKNIYGRGGYNAIRTGFNFTKQEVVLVVMADCSDELSIVDLMYQKICEGYDIVCASRYIKGGKQIGGGLIKKIISRIAGVSLHYLTGIPTRDITNNFKMYRKKVIDSIQIESDGGFEIAMEIVVKAYFLGCKIVEIPSIWQDRARGKSRFQTMKWLPKYLRWYTFALKSHWLGFKQKRRHK